MNDLEITREYKKKPIIDIAQKIGLKEEDIDLYGKYKAKVITKSFKEDKKGKLILVTAVNPTPYGEGKTTVAIGLVDSFNKNKKNAIGVIREPSLGPVFGLKGGACGGGRSQVVPMEDINLHFTGDLHAITSANNLISAAIDNHIYQGNELGIKKILFKRCIDINDRSLRDIKYEIKDKEFSGSFNITAASEIMSIFCLSKDLEDLRRRIGNIVIGVNEKDELIKVKELNIEGSIVVLLKEAFNPNLVQTLENNPVIIHGGPFANISFGCNSIVATKLGLRLSDYIILEAGFGADLGAEKFLDIKCRVGDLVPNCIVLTATIRALKYNGEDLESGIVNLGVHIENLLKFTPNVVVALNKFTSDTEEEINLVRNYCSDRGVSFVVSNSYSNGSEDSKEIVNKIVEICDRNPSLKYIYELESSIKEKIEKIAKEIYRAGEVKFEKFAEEKLKIIEKDYSSLPVCISKTQYSISDDPLKLGSPKDFTITVRDIDVNSGAEFIVVYLGKIFPMPGLPKKPNYEIIDLDKNNNIVGLF